MKDKQGNAWILQDYHINNFRSYHIDN